MSHCQLTPITTVTLRTMFSDWIDIKIISKSVKNGLKETQTFRVYNPSSVWRKPLKKKRVIYLKRLCFFQTIFDTF